MLEHLPQLVTCASEPVAHRTHAAPGHIAGNKAVPVQGVLEGRTLLVVAAASRLIRPGRDKMSKLSLAMVLSSDWPVSGQPKGPGLHGPSLLGFVLA